MPLPWFALWWFLLLLSMLVFYVLLTPIWVGLRAAAWAAELSSRRKTGIRSRGFRSRKDP